MSHRAAGLLLHPTSLPGRFPIGDLGVEAERFLDWCEAAGITWWQVLPLVPPPSHGSPYDALSAFAGNTLLVSPELLADDGLVSTAEVMGVVSRANGRCDFNLAAVAKERLLRRALPRLAEQPRLRAEFNAFRAAPDQVWLDDWTLFAALRRAHGRRSWWEWDAPLKKRDPAALEEARQRLAGEIEFHAFAQFLFHRQWTRLREIARRRGVRILGDLPIYVAHDSAEVWARPELFDLDESGGKNFVAGVPPDYFSETGQLWGNPIYRWDRLAEEGYAWWKARLAANLRLCDAVRLDHFRGFVAYWRVPGDQKTAVHGEWIEGPGTALFEALRDELGDDLPLVAEDLGEITKDVIELRRNLDLPGMHILQFGFDDPRSPHAPHGHERRGVVYTGTHDNDTAAGWYDKLDGGARQRLVDYAGLPAGADGLAAARALERLALTSPADLAVLAAQDVLGLDGAARMNTPAVLEGNWRWRLVEGELSADDAHRVRRLVELAGRRPVSDD